MKPIRTLQNALEIYCIPDESLWQLFGAAREEAMRFCAANDVPLVRVADEFRVPIERAREICEGVMECR